MSMSRPCLPEFGLLPGGPDVREPLEQSAQGDLTLQPRERCPQAEVLASGKRQVLPGVLPGDIELVRLGEDLRITVCGGEYRDEVLAAVGVNPEHVGVPDGPAHRALYRRLESEDFINRVRPQRGFGNEAVVLFGMPHHQLCAAG